MRYRPVDEDGDMRPVQNSSQMLVDTDAVAAAVQSRMDLHRGDWWEDRDIGLEIPQFLVNGLRSEKGVDTMIGYVAAYIKQTRGVKELVSTSTTRYKHSIRADITVRSEFGENVERSVDMNELLRALSR